MTSVKVPPAKLARAIEHVRHHLLQLHQRTVPPPVVMSELILGAWISQAITVAADLGIADAVAAAPLPVDALAARVNADPDALRRLLRALISCGIFRQRRDGRYELNPLGDTLRSASPASMAGLARWVGSRQHREHWSLLASAVRTGKAIIPQLRGMEAFDYLGEEPELAEVFNQAMTNLSQSAAAPIIAAYDFTGYSTIVDVGGGHGELLAAILAAAPAAHGVLYDLPHVVVGAPPLLHELDVADRARIAEGSFFDSVPAGGDIYILKNVIHDWPDDKAIQILRNVHVTADTATTVLLIEIVIPEHHRESIGKWTDLEMLLASAARERTAAEYRHLLQQAGFQTTRVIETASPYSIVEAWAG
ncbi:MAG: hydroxyneurosporene methyltransferase [Mycobacterium sp.]|nr:hydroxyneurosporene methyltransferase [Mycobacterium sp.]